MVDITNNGVGGELRDWGEGSPESSRGTLIRRNHILVRGEFVKMLANGGEGTPPSLTGENPVFFPNILFVIKGTLERKTCIHILILRLKKLSYIHVKIKMKFR